MRLAAGAAHQFGGIELDRSKPLGFKLDGRVIQGFAGDTVLSAVLAGGIDTYGAYQGALLGLGETFAPLVNIKRGTPLPMSRTPALDGLEFTTIGARARGPFGTPRSLRHKITVPPDPGWLAMPPDTTLTADLLIVGGGVAGLAAAKSAGMAGRSVILCERRPWLGGDARYFGPVGDAETPEALIGRLAGRLIGDSTATVLLRTEILRIDGLRAIAHQVDIADGVPRGRIVVIEAGKILLATGSTQRLPVFPGNRMPGVIPAIEAYHLAKRYGAALGPTAIVATQSNYGYRLALRLHDAGVAVSRVVDTRLLAQSRFIDFAKATGLTLASSQYPLVARPGHFSMANVGATTVATTLEASQLIVSGTWQPDLTLWMQAGGGVRWDAQSGALVTAGHLRNVAVAGSAAGEISMLACAHSGRTAQAQLFGEAREPFEDSEPGTALETPDAATPHAPAVADSLSFFSGGATLANRLLESQRHALSLSDVAASVELGLVAPADAGAIAEERGAPGADLVASDWRPTATERAGADLPAYLQHRFGDAPRRLQLRVDGKRTFEIGALVYRNTDPADPARAIGVIVETVATGGIALVDKEAAELDRFIVETVAGPSPARVAQG
jgi:sarcosine oxidase subunit alpha